MKPLKPEGQVMRLVRRLAYRLVGIRFGPAMLQIRGEWLYIGPCGGTWRVVPTGDEHSPLMIMREKY